MQVCLVCGAEKNHRISERNGKFTKECVSCGHADGASHASGAPKRAGDPLAGRSTSAT